MTQRQFFVNICNYYYYYTRLTALFPGLPRWAGTRKVKPIWILLKQETVSGSGIKSAPRSRQITMPSPHHLVFLQALPADQPNSIKGTLVTFARSLINAPQGSLQHTPCCQQRVRGHSKDRRLQWQSGDWWGLECARPDHNIAWSTARRQLWHHLKQQTEMLLWLPNKWMVQSNLSKWIPLKWIW